MYYQATYNGEAYLAARESAFNMVRNDTYYAMNSGDGYGTGILHRKSDLKDGWGDYYLSPLDGIVSNPGRWCGADPTLIPDEVLMHHRYIQWMSCAKNLIRYKFDHEKKEVCVTISSRRHGIPDRTLEKFTPVRIHNYETQSDQNSSPWAMDLKPCEKVPSN